MTALLAAGIFVATVALVALIEAFARAIKPSDADVTVLEDRLDEVPSVREETIP